MIDGQIDGRVQRGDSTRRTILRRAVDIASVDGLSGLSIGRLATDLRVSKSGVFAHFGSKEELQLATISAAGDIFFKAVVKPAMAELPGVRRVRALFEGWLEYSAGRIFPGGCFFAAVSAEFDAQPGRVRDAIAQADAQWVGLIEQSIGDAKRLAEIADDVDAAQLGFELNAYVHAANAASLLHGDGDAYLKASIAVDNRVTSSAKAAASRGA